MSYVESMKEKRIRKKEKISKWLNAGDRGHVKRNANGVILSQKQHYKKLPIETPIGRDSKLREWCED